MIDKTTHALHSSHIVVLIPCYNEETTIATVVRDFRAALPDALIYVYDNNSKDRTLDLARNAGAIVRTEPLQGKGNVVCRMFGDIDADIYLIVDGDATYDAASAPGLIHHLMTNQLDMVCGARVDHGQGAYRPGHRLGNRLLTDLVGIIFGDHFNDMLTGYRVFSRRFVKSFPALSAGFEIETQLTVHALEMRLRVAEIPTPYSERPEGSTSKLHTYKDGWRILKTIAYLVKEERPLAFFSIIATCLAITASLLSWPLISYYMETGLVPRFPTAILATGMMILAFLSFVSGLILDSLAHARREIKRLHFLGIPHISAALKIDRPGSFLP
ncbi:MAG: glycosyltransferase [Chromatiaceae bacterium]|nr:glycosyltransferase [Chromatiaceae bacterium]